MSATSHEPNYVNYRLEQLECARRSIDVERFPERAHLLDVLIADRKRQTQLQQPMPTTSTNPLAMHAPVQLVLPRPRERYPLRGNALLRRLLGCLSIWGGLSGALAFLLQLANSQGLFSGLLLLGFSALYCWSVWCGVELLEGRPGAIHRNQLLWALQVPLLTSTWFCYSFASGAIAVLWVRLSEFSFGANINVGSQGQFRLAVPDEPFVVGINLFAVIIVALLVALEDSFESAGKPATAENEQSAPASAPPLHTKLAQVE